MANIDDFKANLIGGGARANQFRVTITPPSGIAIGLDVRRASFLVTTASLPQSQIGEIPVPFRGRNIYVTGDTRGGLDGNTNSGSYDIFLVKYNSSGTKQ